jgi:hypothetical protein
MPTMNCRRGVLWDSNSGNFTTFAAIGRASSFVSSLGAGSAAVSLTPTPIFFGLALN